MASVISSYSDATHDEATELAQTWISSKKNPHKYAKTVAAKGDMPWCVATHRDKPHPPSDSGSVGSEGEQSPADSEPAAPVRIDCILPGHAGGTTRCPTCRSDALSGDTEHLHATLAAQGAAARPDLAALLTSPTDTGHAPEVAS